MSLKDQINAITNRTKVKIYKPEGNPDDRVSLAGEKVQVDDNGQQFFCIPAHQAEYQITLHPHYEILGEAFVEEAKRGPGRPAKGD